MADNEGLARTLSSAIERAVSDVLSATNRVTQGTQRNVQTTPSPSNSGLSRQQTLLPSAFQRQHVMAQVQPPPKRKRSRTCQPKPGKIYTKDIVCIPPKVSKKADMVPIPRGDSRAQLAEMGLVGKVSIESTWSAYEVENEIRSVFLAAFNLNTGVPFEYTYLSTMPGTKKLSVPRISSSFKWNAPEVLSICSQGAIYITSKEDPPKYIGVEDDNESRDSDSQLLEDPFEFSGGVNPPLVDNSMNSCMEVNSGASTSSRDSIATTHYRSYIDLIEDDVIISSDEENADLQSAISNSLVDVEETASITSILQDHIKKEMAGLSSNADAPKNFINIRRKYAFKDGIQKLKRPTFIASHPLSVKFANETGQSEGAIDRGGPTREFLRLAIRQMFDSKLFGGADNNKVFILDQEAKQDELYQLCGKLVAVSLCNGGGAGRCFSKSIYNFIARGEKAATPGIQDVSDTELRTILNKITTCQNEDQFKQLMPDLLEYLTQAGWTSTVSFSKKKKLVSTLCQYSVIDKTRSCLEQFKEGLRTLGILQLILKHPGGFEDVFCHEANELTSKLLDDLFFPLLSDEGTQQREKEEQIIMHWRDYLFECQGQTTHGQATLRDILIFATGSEEIPPTGFDPPPTIEFWEDTKPRANTCGNVLHLPLHPEKQEVDYEYFKEMMNFGLLNSPCFGCA